MPAQRVALLALLVMFVANACTPEQSAEPPPEPQEEEEDQLLELATSDSLTWTGLAIKPSDGRLFACYPRWFPMLPLSVAEIVDGEPVPFPDEHRNGWSPEEGDAMTQFVCVQSLWTDRDESLWVLDAGNPWFSGVIDGGAKLFRFDTRTGELLSLFWFSDLVLSQGSYLNDVRIDLDSGYAYITDSGDGALIVLDLSSGWSRRLLDEHPSAHSEGIILTVDGSDWLMPGEVAPEVHADGIALSPDGSMLYYHALTGENLYRVPTEALRDPDVGEDDLEAMVESLGETGACDGMIFGPDGKLYLSALERNAIVSYDTATGELNVEIEDERIRWPDSFTIGTGGMICFTTSQLHLGGAATGSPCRILGLRPQPGI